MNQKGKGTKAERDLIHKFWQEGWAALRAAGSGSMKYDCPDIIAGNHDKKIAIECKATKAQIQYLTKEEIFALRSFSHLFGAKPYIGVRFNMMEWVFFEITSLKETGKNYAVSRELAKEKGFSFSELLNK
jgi:Holliday junction resolvase